MYKPYLTHMERRVKSEFITMLQGMPKETTFALTLATNSKNMRSASESIEKKREKFDKLLSQWDKILCRKFVGPNYHKQHRKGERQSGFVFPEKFHDNPHYHLILDIKNWCPNEYLLYAEETWIELWEPGTIHVEPLYGNNWETYVTKDWNMSEPNSWIAIPYG